MSVVRIGNLSFAAGAVEWATSTRTTFDANGLPAQYLMKVDLRGQLLGSDVVNLAAQSGALRQACLRQFQDVVLLADSGQVLESLRNATSLSGVRIQGPDFPDGRGAQFVGYRDFTLSAEAVYAGIGNSSQLVEWTESVTATGGGPIYSFLIGKTGPAYKVRDAEQTPYLATQQGSIVSLIPNPKPPPPRWPAAVMRGPEIRRDKPRFDNGRWMYGISYTYSFGSTSPLT